MAERMPLDNPDDPAFERRPDGQLRSPRRYEVTVCTPETRDRDLHRDDLASRIQGRGIGS